MYLNALDLTTDSRAQPSGHAPVDPVRRLFYQALGHHRARRYGQAIIAFERIRHWPGVAPNVAAACLYNIAVTNRKLRRFATALIYFERYIASPAISDRDRSRAQERLDATKRSLGISTP